MISSSWSMVGWSVVVHERNLDSPSPNTSPFMPLCAAKDASGAWLWVESKISGIKECAKVSFADTAMEDKSG
jgi:hypothetical protein